jgi:hypothetical protein
VRMVTFRRTTRSPGRSSSRRCGCAEDDAREVLGVLVAQLDRRVQARGRAVRRREQVAVLSVGDQRLRVQRALDVPALVVVASGGEIGHPPAGATAGRGRRRRPEARRQERVSRRPAPPWGSRRRTSGSPRSGPRPRRRVARRRPARGRARARRATRPRRSTPRRSSGSRAATREGGAAGRRARAAAGGRPAPAPPRPPRAPTRRRAWRPTRGPRARRGSWERPRRRAVRAVIHGRVPEQPALHHLVASACARSTSCAASGPREPHAASSEVPYAAASAEPVVRARAPNR